MSRHLKIFFLCLSIVTLHVGCGTKEEHWTIYSNTGYVSTIAAISDSLWLGTNGGLVQWNKKKETYKKFTTLDGLGSHQISFICRDSFKNLWIGGKHTLTRFDGKKFEAFHSKNIFADSWKDYEGNRLGRQVLFRVAGRDKEGNLWFMAGNGISTYNGQKWIHRDLSSFLPEERGFIYLDTKEKIWALNRGHGVYVIDSDKTTLFSQEDGMPDNDPRIFLEDSKGNIWVSSTSRGLSRFDGKKWKSYQPSTNLSDYGEYPLFEDRQGYIYFGTDKGFCRFDGMEWTSFEEVSDFRITKFTEDNEGKLWAATTKGVCWWNGEKWIFLDYHPEEHLTNNWVITGAIDKEGKLWFGTGTGVTVFNGTEWYKYPLLRNRVNDILTLNNGEVWAAMEGGVGRFINGEWNIYISKDALAYLKERGIARDLVWELCVVEDGLAHLYASSIAQDLEGNLWIGTYDGLSRFDGEEWKIYTTEDGLSHNSVWSIDVDSKGRIWCGTSKGVCAFDGTSWENYTPPEGLPEGNCRILLDSQDVLWFGSVSMGGIASFDGKLWKRMTMEDGLPDNFIHSITEDDEGRIWVATENGGACVFKGNEWRYFSPDDGLPSYYVRKILIDKKGDIWFTTNGGIAKLEGFRFPK